MRSVDTGIQEIAALAPGKPSVVGLAVTCAVTVPRPFVARPSVVEAPLDEILAVLAGFAALVRTLIAVGDDLPAVFGVGASGILGPDALTVAGQRSRRDQRVQDDRGNSSRHHSPPVAGHDQS